MIVKIGDRCYDANKEPVMIVLSDADKENIANMHPECTKYCCYPETGYTEEAIREFMIIA